MKTIIAGSRTITDFQTVFDAFSKSGFTMTEVVSGTAKGVDRLGERLAIALDIPIKRFPADWNQYGKSAGVIRNKQMGDYADALIAVWDGKSKGTKQMIDYAKSKGLKVFVYKHMSYKYFVGDINYLEPNEVFVFGSNEAGIHGSGAARIAKDNFGAVYGEGIGFTGQCYGIPTKDTKIKTLPLNKIKAYVYKFIEDIKDYPETTFIVTQIGCGLAGYKPEQIAPMFKRAPENCMFDIAWRDFLE